MSTFINANNQLTDKDFFGTKVVYKLPKSLSNKSEKNKFKTCHNTIKQLLTTSRGKIPTQELKELVSIYYNATPEQQSAILREGIPNHSSEPSTPSFSHLTHLYAQFIQDHKVHKTKYLNLNYLDTWNIFNQIHFKGDLTLENVNRDLLNQFVNWRHEFRKPNCSRSGLVSDATIHKEIQELKNCFEWCFSENLSNEVPRIFQVKYKAPTRGVRQEVIPLSVDEQKNLIEQMTQEDPFYHDYFLLLLITGLRVGEINKLSRDSFDLEEGTLTIHSLSIGNTIVGGKTEAAPRRLPLNPTLISIFERGHIFQSSKTYKIGKNTYDKPLKGKRDSRIQSFISARKEQGKLSKSFHLHQLRHTFVTNNLQAERSTLEVSRWAGHKSINITTDRYGKYLQLGIEKIRVKYVVHLECLERLHFKPLT